jgi:hypothetical protein
MSRLENILSNYNQFATSQQASVNEFKTQLENNVKAQQEAETDSDDNSLEMIALHFFGDKIKNFLSEKLGLNPDEVSKFAENPTEYMQNSANDLLNRASNSIQDELTERGLNPEGILNRTEQTTRNLVDSIRRPFIDDDEEIEAFEEPNFGPPTDDEEEEEDDDEPILDDEPGLTTTGSSAPFGGVRMPGSEELQQRFTAQQETPETRPEDFVDDEPDADAPPPPPPVVTPPPPEPDAPPPEQPVVQPPEPPAPAPEETEDFVDDEPDAQDLIPEGAGTALPGAALDAPPSELAQQLIQSSTPRALVESANDLPSFRDAANSLKSIAEEKLNLEPGGLDNTSSSDIANRLDNLGDDESKDVANNLRTLTDKFNNFKQQQQSTNQEAQRNTEQSQESELQSSEAQAEQASTQAATEASSAAMDEAAAETAEDAEIGEIAELAV